MCAIIRMFLLVICFDWVDGRTRADDHRVHVADIRLLKGVVIVHMSYFTRLSNNNNYS